jgi:hypothetical protein
MAIEKRGEHWYGDSQADITAEIARYIERNAYPAEHFAEAVCECGKRTFRLLVDDDHGAAVRVCVSCGRDHPIGDTAEYLSDAVLEECECPCGSGTVEVTAGVALYEGSEDGEPLYVGCRCPACGLVACCSDWPIEYEGYQELLGRI